MTNYLCNLVIKTYKDEQMMKNNEMDKSPSATTIPNFQTNSIPWNFISKHILV